MGQSRSQSTQIYRKSGRHTPVVPRGLTPEQAGVKGKALSPPLLGHFGRVLPPRAQTSTLIAETGQTAGVGWSTLQCG